MNHYHSIQYFNEYMPFCECEGFNFVKCETGDLMKFNGSLLHVSYYIDDLINWYHDKIAFHWLIKGPPLRVFNIIYNIIMSYLYSDSHKSIFSKNHNLQSRRQVIRRRTTAKLKWNWSQKPRGITRSVWQWWWAIILKSNSSLDGGTDNYCKNLIYVLLIWKG